MLDILKAILYGIVEGISEWLPISSTGHLIVLDGFLHMEETYPDFWPFFLVVIQLGAILAIVVNFFSELNPFSFKKTKLERKTMFMCSLLVTIARTKSISMNLIKQEILIKPFNT